MPNGDQEKLSELTADSSQSNADISIHGSGAVTDEWERILVARFLGWMTLPPKMIQ